MSEEDISTALPAPSDLAARDTRHSQTGDSHAAISTDIGEEATDLYPSALTAVTFDFWNTLYSANDGAMDRARPRRLEALRAALSAGGADPSGEQMQHAYRAGFEAYMGAWGNGRHFGAREQVLFFLDYFGVEAQTVPESVIAAAAHEIEEASMLADLELLPGARETVPVLASAGYALGIISDTSLTPGRILRRFLERDGLLTYFKALTFSDETGYPKPDARMFTATLAALDAQAHRAAHVGDTPRTDIAGAKALGIVAIRYTAAADQEEPPAADFVIRDHRELPALLAGLT